MADISDVLVGIGQLLGDTLYPNGAVGDAVVGAPVLIQPGWPDSATLQAELPAGKAFISIFPATHERSTTRYPEVRAENPIPDATWSLTVDGQRVTVGGGNSMPYTVQNVAVVANGKIYVVQPGQADSPGSVCGALYNAMVGDIADLTTDGASLVFGATDRIQAARVGVFGSTTKEVGRVERQVSIIIWSGTPDLRDAIAKRIDPVIRAARRVVMDGGETARLTYVRSMVIDAQEKEGIYRRDLVFAAEYGVTLTESWPQIVANKIVTEPTADDLTLEVGSTEYPSAAAQFVQSLEFDIAPTTSSSA